MIDASDRPYYVYVYIDPRNYEEFYYGKGKGARKRAHLADTGDSEKAHRIQAICKAGEAPIIKTVATGLTEQEAHLIETTLIWRLGRTLTNQVSGHHVKRFRPPDTMHKELSGFDFQNEIYYFNVGEGVDHRRWEDCRALGFLSAGGGTRWRNQVLDIVPGDVLVAYLKRHGFVGVGQVSQRARPFHEVRVQGKLLNDFGPKTIGMGRYADDLDHCEYPILVDWIKAVGRTEAKWQSKSDLYATPLVKASLDNQPRTLSYIEHEFGVKLDDLVR